MRQASQIALLAMALAFGSPLEVSAQAKTVSSDATAVRAALDGIQAAWNRHDMSAFVSYMTDDVDWVNVVGMHWHGKAQVFLAHDRMHRTTFKSRQWHDADMTELRQVSPGVIIATQSFPMDGFPAPDGSSTPPNRNMMTLVFVHRNGRWLIAQGHNTAIDPQAAAHDPGK
jgi:uncharacterized protein (TIGR02246 family)